MEVTQDIKLNINDTGQYTVVTVKQADSGRILNVTMVDDNTEIEIPSTATASIRVLKEDGTSVDNACTISDGKIVVELTDQITAVAGYAKADISVASGGKIVSTATFLIKVGAVPMGVEIVSSNEFTRLTALIESASQYETRIGNLEEVPKTYYGTVSEIDESGTMEVEGNSVDLMAYYGLEEGTTLYVMFGCDWMETEHEQYFSIIGIESIAINNKSSVDEWISDYAWFSTGDIKQFVYDGANWVLQDAMLSEAINNNAEDISEHNTRITAVESQPRMWHGISTTEMATAVKIVTTQSGFAFRLRDYISVTFNEPISNNDLYLNVNDTGEKPVKYKGQRKIPCTQGRTTILFVMTADNAYTVVGEINALPDSGGKAIVTDSIGRFMGSSVTSTELGYLSGATGNIQEQIDDIEDETDALESGKQGKIAFAYCYSDKDDPEKVIELESGYTFDWQDGEFLMVHFNYGNSVSLISMNIAGVLYPYDIPCGDLSEGKSALFRVYHKGLAFGISAVCGGNNVWSNGNTIIVN